MSHKREGVWVPVSPHGGEQPSLREHLPELLTNEKQTFVEFVPFYILACLCSCNLTYPKLQGDQIARVPWLISEESGTEPCVWLQEPLLDCTIFSKGESQFHPFHPLYPTSVTLKNYLLRKRINQLFEALLYLCFYCNTSQILVASRCVEINQ